MDDKALLNRRYETIAWGAFFIVWGLTSLLRFLPDGAGAVGIGIILLGLNAARYFSNIPTSGFTITLGVIALVLGSVDMLRAVLQLPVDLPFFPLLLIVIGVIWLVRGVTRSVR
jgi:hypothetical protein